MRPAMWHLACRLAAAVMVPFLPFHATASPARILRVAYQVAPDSFDPDNAFLLSGLDAMRVIYQGPAAYAPGTVRIVPALARDWTISADRLTYSFALRTDIHFQDGARVTGQAVLSSLRRRAEGGFALSYFLAGASAIEAPDPAHVVIRLAVPDPAFLDRLASSWGPRIVGPGALVAHAGTDRAAGWLNAHSDGTGPYALGVVRPGRHITLQRNPAYGGPAPYFDEIQIFIIPNIGQQALLLQDGALDVVPHGYPFDRLAALPAGLAIDAYQDLGTETAYVNLSRALRVPAVREAVFVIPLVRRVATLAGILLAMTFLIFVLQALIPGDPARLALGPSAPLSAGLRLALIAASSLPIFLTALLLSDMFWFHLHWLPSGGRLSLDRETEGGGGFVWLAALFSGDVGRLMDASAHLALPATTLMLPVAVGVGRTFAASLQTVSAQTYIRTARAKGLTEWQVFRHHMLRNAAVPVLGMIALQVTILFGNLVVVERIFAWPGLGAYSALSFGAADLPAIQGTALVFAGLYIATSTCIDALQSLCDPRPRQ